MASRETWYLDVNASCHECNWRGTYKVWNGKETVKQVMDDAAEHTNETGHETNVETVQNSKHLPGTSKSAGGFVEINYPVKDKQADIKLPWDGLLGE